MSQSSTRAMLTMVEAARTVRVSVATMRYWRQTGTGPSSFKVGRHVRYWEDEVRDWLASRSAETGRPARAGR